MEVIGTVEYLKKERSQEWRTELRSNFKTKERIQLERVHMPEQEPVTRKQEPDELRTYGVGAQIIADLGVKRMRVLSAPKIVHGIAGFGLEVVDYVS